jgi:hypothetical protein
MKPPQFQDPMKEVRESMRALTTADPMKEVRESMRALTMADPMKEVRESMRALTMADPMKEVRESMRALTMADPRKSANPERDSLCGLLRRLDFQERIKGDHHIFSMANLADHQYSTQGHQSEALPGEADPGFPAPA